MTLRSWLPVVLLIAVAGPSAAAPIEKPHVKVGESFIQLVAAGDVAGTIAWTAKRFIKGGNDKPGPSVQGLKELLEGAGPLHGYVLAREQNIGDRFVKLEYLVLGQQRPLAFELVLYRPASEWVVYSWGWYSDPRIFFLPSKARKE